MVALYYTHHESQTARPVVPNDLALRIVGDATQDKSFRSLVKHLTIIVYLSIY